MREPPPHPRPRVVHLDDLEAVPGPGTLMWRPVRMELGIQAFGTNAYTAQEAGHDVVEPHTESPKLAARGAVLRRPGRARFTLDGETFEAPTGTYVFVPDPNTHRHAIAEEAGTTVLSFGGPPTFTPSAWEWSFRANALRQSDPERARAIFAEGLEVHPESPGLRYNLACLEALQGIASRRSRCCEARWSTTRAGGPGARRRGLREPARRRGLRGADRGLAALFGGAALRDPAQVQRLVEHRLLHAVLARDLAQRAPSSRPP